MEEEGALVEVKRMRIRRSWRWVLGIGAIGCGARVSVGDLGTDNGHDGSSMAGAPTSSTAGPTTGGAGRATGTVTGGSSGSTGAGGSAAGGSTVYDSGNIGPHDASPRDASMPSVRDVNIDVDVGNLGGAACGGIEYPETAFYGTNVLYPSFSYAVSKSGPGNYDFAAKLAPGASLDIRLTNSLYRAADGNPRPAAVWVFSGVDWRYLPYDYDTGVQLFEAADSGRSIEMQFGFQGSGWALVEYFECGSSVPTGTKILYWDAP
jgi:hypothetical protein